MDGAHYQQMPKDIKLVTLVIIQKIFSRNLIGQPRGSFSKTLFSILKHYTNCVQDLNNLYSIYSNMNSLLLTWPHNNLNWYNLIILYVTRPAKIDHLSAKNRPLLVSLLYHNHLYYCNKIFITTTEHNGLTFAAYRNGTVHLKRKILAKI